jgi:hypothetical protein
LLDAMLWTDVEEAVLGVPRDLPARRRVIYGYAGLPDFAGFLAPTERAVATYGQACARLKPTVRERATFTVGDCLTNRDEIQASRVESPEPTSFLATRGQGISGHAAELLLRDPRRRQNLEDLQSLFRYVEVHYHGGLKLADVAEIAFPDDPPPGLIPFFSKRVIPWRVIRKPQVQP